MKTKCSDRIAMIRFRRMLQVCSVPFDCAPGIVHDSSIVPDREFLLYVTRRVHYWLCYHSSLYSSLLKHPVSFYLRGTQSARLAPLRLLQSKDTIPRYATRCCKLLMVGTGQQAPRFFHYLPTHLQNIAVLCWICAASNFKATTCQLVECSVHHPTVHNLEQPRPL